MTAPIPGPYFIDEDRAAICTRCERTGEVLTLAMFTEWGESDRAMARALVSRLDLLAALKALLEGCEQLDPEQAILPQQMQAARATLDKAEGRDSASLDAMRAGAGRYRRALAGLAKS